MLPGDWRRRIAAVLDSMAASLDLAALLYPIAKVSALAVRLTAALWRLITGR